MIEQQNLKSFLSQFEVAIRNQTPLRHTHQHKHSDKQREATPCWTCHQARNIRPAHSRYDISLAYDITGKENTGLYPRAQEFSENTLIQMSIILRHRVLNISQPQHQS